MRGANTTITVARLVETGNHQKAYGTPHATCEAAIHPASKELAQALGVPLGQAYDCYTEDLVYPDTLQISDCITDTRTGKKYIVTGVNAWEHDLCETTMTSYTPPRFSTPS